MTLRFLAQALKSLHVLAPCGQLRQLLGLIWNQGASGLVVVGLLLPLDHDASMRRCKRPCRRGGDECRGMVFQKGEVVEMVRGALGNGHGTRSQ